jgi:WD40 repeat protein
MQLVAGLLEREDLPRF